jgi:hypothetical protein
MANDKLNGYSLTKAWFNYTFEHPEKFNPTDGYIYLFLIEVANRSGWSDKFDVSAKDIMQALGIGTYNTYRKSFDKLVADGWITVVKKSTNQFQKTVIALSKNNTATNGALDRALYQAGDVAGDVAELKADAPIIKTVNYKPKTVNEKGNHSLTTDLPIGYKREWEIPFMPDFLAKITSYPNGQISLDKITELWETWVQVRYQAKNKRFTSDISEAQALKLLLNGCNTAAQVIASLNKMIASESANPFVVDEKEMKKDTIIRDHLGRDVSRMG